MAKKKSIRRKADKTWVDYAQMRERLDAGVLLTDFDIEWKERGDQIICKCPFHEDRRASFSFNREKGIWQCFGCKLSGNVLDLAVQLHGGDAEDPTSFRAHAIEIQSRYCPDLDSKGSEPRSKQRKPQTPAVVPESANRDPEKRLKPGTGKIIVVNPPLDFELTDLDHTHPYLVDRGFTENTMRHFGAGFCNRGLMKDRIAIPIHNEGSELVGYAGRAVDDNAISDDFPKYRFPGERIVNDIVHRFAKSELLYNFEWVDPNDHLIIVEGFASVWWLHQHGFENVVAVMGSSLSDDQVEMLALGLNEHTMITVMPDGDDAGDHLGSEAMIKLGEKGWWCRWHRLSRGLQPTDLNEPQDFEELRVSAMI